MNGSLGQWMCLEGVGVCVCVWRKRSVGFLCFFLSPHLFHLFPRRGGDESQSHGVTLNFGARRPALSSPLSDRCI